MSNKTIVQLLQEKGLLSDPPLLSEQSLEIINTLDPKDVKALEALAGRLGDAHFIETCVPPFFGF